MAFQYLIIGIEAAPGDAPRAVEQLNGDLLLPANGRWILEDAIAKAEEALPASADATARSALADARRLLGIVREDRNQQTLQANLLKVRPI